MTRATDWTPADDATLVRLIGKGFSAKQIGKDLGRTRSATCGRAYRKGLVFGGGIAQIQAKRDYANFTAEEDQAIGDMATAGKSGQAIADAIGRKKSSVVQRARKLGTPVRAKNGPVPKPKEPKVKGPKLHPGNIASKKESRTHDPEFKHRTPSVAVVPLMVALVDLAPDMCRFPVAGERADTLFCGHPKDERAYCSAHSKLAYQAPEARRGAA